MASSTDPSNRSSFDVAIDELKSLLSSTTDEDFHIDCLHDFIVQQTRNHQGHLQPRESKALMRLLVNVLVSLGADGTISVETQRACLELLPPEIQGYSLSQIVSESPDGMFGQKPHPAPSDTPKLQPNKDNTVGTGTVMVPMENTPKEPEIHQKSPAEILLEKFLAKVDSLTETQLRLLVVKMMPKDVESSKNSKILVNELLKFDKIMLKKVLVREFERPSLHISRLPSLDDLPVMPALVPVQEPGLHGVWILIPKSNPENVETVQNFELCYKYRAGSAIVSCPHEREAQISPTPSFGPGAFLIPTMRAHPRSVWVCMPPSSQGSDGSEIAWSIYSRSLSGHGNPRFLLPSETRPMAVVPNVLDGIWALVVGWSPDSLVQLELLSDRYNSGKVFVRALPTNCRLISHAKGGVFVYVPHSRHPYLAAADSTTSHKQGILAPGLWFISVFGQRTRLLPSPIEEDWHVTNDTAHLGVWVVTPSTTGRSRSVVHHLTAPAASSSEQDQPQTTQELRRDHHKEQTIDVEFESIQSILDGGGDHVGEEGAAGGSVLLHHKEGDRWKLSHARIGRRAPTPFHDCPKSNQICEDGRGGVWMMKKVGKNAERVLMHINDDGKLAECKVRFAEFSTMAGSS